MNREQKADIGSFERETTADLPHALPCIGCGEQLTNIAGVNQPNHGIEFTAQGHYGTRVFDPMDGSQIAINVCDECLKRAGFAGMVLRYSNRGAEPWCTP